MQKLLMILFLGTLLFSANVSEAKKGHRDPVKTAAVAAHKKSPSVQPANKKARPTTATEVVCLKNPSVPKGRLDITERICAAKKLLTTGTTEYGTCQKQVRECRGKGKKKVCVEKTKTFFCAKTALIASLDPQTGKLKMVAVNAETGTSKTAGYNVRRIVRDGVDSEYAVSVPPGQLVVGLQLPVQIKTARGLVVEGAVYTPYTRELREAYPELVTLGWNYLQEGISTAHRKIEASGVELENINPQLIFTLVLIEHFTNEELSDAEVEEEMYRVALTVGANGKAAYHYSVSQKGARCLGQFMEDTWNRLRGRFPRLLPSDFLKGSASHDQAFMAQWLLAREDLAYLFSQKRWRGNSPQKLKLLSDLRLTGEYLALSYNGGAPRAHRWLASTRLAKLPDEGQKYIRKFHQVWSVLEDLLRQSAKLPRPTQVRTKLARQ